MASLDESMKKTADLLGRIVKKPPLTPKLLSKPPFRYLHDLLSEVINSSGWAQGLYDDEEMNSENVKEKNAKIAYLTKMIDCLGFATGVEIKANPMKIVAGLDPEDTNFMLQILAKAVLKKVDYSDPVKRVLAGEHYTGGKRRASRDEPATGRGSAKGSQNELRKETSQPDLGARKLQRQSSMGSTELLGSAKSKAPVKQEQPVVSEPATAAPPADRHPQERTSSPPPRPPPSQLQQDVISPEPPTTQAPLQQSTISSSPVPVAQPPSAVPQKPANTTSSSRPPPVPQQDQRPVQAEPRNAPSVATAAVSDDTAAGPFVPEDPIRMAEDLEDRQARAAATARRMRPASARPAPPRQKAPEVALEEVPKDVPLIFTDKSADIDDDDFVVIVHDNEEPAAPTAQEEGPKADERHGGLVRTILQSKQEMENDKDGGKNRPKTSKERLTGGKKEIEMLREWIQALTRSTNPLGKALDYMQEDVDSMNRELDTWRAEHKKYQGLLDLEAVTTKELIAPLEAQLSTIEGFIAEQIDKITGSKAAILQADEGIQKLLRAITRGDS
ncbi:microtubule-binding protein MIP-T3-domain-containing protein [Phlyctochytrium arcticum]|nr:microtubule-binding protein MIP-T3-domain-containing protein [Phlyctochytrium arcticum]